MPYTLFLSVAISLTQAGQPGSNDYLTLTSVYERNPSVAGLQQFGVTRRDFEALQQQLPKAKQAVIVRTMLSSASYGENRVSVPLIGCSAGLDQLAQAKISRGRFFRRGEFQSAENVCVIGKALSKQLFGETDPIGLNIHIDRYYFLVVGIADRPQTDLSSVTATYRMIHGKRLSPEQLRRNQEVYVPFRTMKARFGDANIVRSESAFEGRAFAYSEIWLPNVTQLEERIVRELILPQHAKNNDVRIERLRAGKRLIENNIKNNPNEQRSKK